jgi:hypothetical protein
MADNSGKRRVLWWTVEAVITIVVVGVIWAALKRIHSSSDWFVPSRVGAGVLVALAILWKVPQWQVGPVRGLEPKERFGCNNEARKTLATILGGALLLTGGYLTWRNFNLAREGQITDRFSKAIEQLGAVDARGEKKLEVRLGGIYALERIANDSERDHWPVMEVLCAYVRVNARTQRENPPSKEQKHKKPTPANQASTTPPRPDEDIQTILTVLGRRDRTHEQGNVLNLGTALRGADLQGADLRKADLSNANLEGTDLGGAALSEAILRRVHLRGAFLPGADLRRAILSGAALSQADLSKAYLSEAHLNGVALNEANLNGALFYKADLSGADLTFADVSGADLTFADLGGADLRYARNLTQQQIDVAEGDLNTRLPDNLHVPERWKK